jgi:hypothetical protein
MECVLMKLILSEEKVRAIFSSSENEFDVLIALFKITISNWDEVEYILEGKPHMGAEGWHAIYELFCKFNEDHPGESAFPGGLWLSMGFIKDESLGTWQVDSSEMKFAFKNVEERS